MLPSPRRRCLPPPMSWSLPNLSQSASYVLPKIAEVFDTDEELPDLELLCNLLAALDADDHARHVDETFDAELIGELN